MLILTQKDISDDELRELYPSLIERLDDSQNPNRLRITHAINIFFHCPNLKKAPTIFEYVLQGVFIHFDDNDEDVQDAIMVTLKHAATFDAKKVLIQAQNARLKMKNTAKCE
jgi:ABC-type phosphate transport system ATPase subunit